MKQIIIILAIAMACLVASLFQPYFFIPGIFFTLAAPGMILREFLGWSAKSIAAFYVKLVLGATVLTSFTIYAMNHPWLLFLAAGLSIVAIAIAGCLLFGRAKR